MKRILIVGKGFSGLTSYLRDHKYDYIVLKDLLGAKWPDKQLKRRVLCDFSSKQAVLSAVDSIAGQIDGVMCVYENYAVPAAWVAEHLGLPGMPLASVEACTDKFLMRHLFAQAPEPISPDFSLVDSQKDVIAFAQTHGFPLVLKPANLAKSLLVTKNHNLDELLENYQRTTAQIESVYARYAPNRTPRILVEEFLQGSVHSVDAFVGADGKAWVLNEIVDYQTGYDIGFDDNFHYSRVLPSRLSRDEQAALRHCAVLAIQALGMRNSPAHVEVIMTARGPRIVEIGARNGGYRERMHALANGIEIYGAAVAIALGMQPNITATRQEPCAVLELFPKEPGFFQGIAQEQQLLQLPSLHSLHVQAKAGQFVGKSADGHKSCAVVILHSADADQFRLDLDWVAQQAVVITTLGA